MKRIISIMLALVLMLLCGICACAEEENSTVEIMPTTEMGIPQFSYIQHISVTFYVANGKASASYLVSVSGKRDIDIDIVIEKKTLGFIWADVAKSAVSVKNVQYYSGDFNADVSGSGEYRVRISAKVNGEKAEKTVGFTYDESIFLGDVNGDGRITAYDARLVLRYSAKMESFTEKQKVFADINSDGKITASDARIVLRIAAKL